MIVQKTNVYMLSSSNGQCYIDPEDYEIYTSALVSAIEENAKAKLYSVANWDTITGFCALYCRDVILRRAAMERGTDREIINRACEMMDSYLELQSYNDWIDLKACMKDARLCYTEIADDSSDLNYYEIANSPQYNMIDSGISKYNGECVDVFTGYKSLPREEAEEYDDICVDVSGDIYDFDLEILLEREG